MAATQGYSHLIRSLNKCVSRPIKLKTSGQIPKWLRGTLFRNGPGKYEFNDMKYAHFFDGHSCISKFSIENGEVTFFNRFLETECHKKTTRDKRLYPVFGTADPQSTLLDRFRMLFVLPKTNDNVNVSIHNFGEEMYALTETNFVCSVDPVTLDVKHTVDICEAIPNLTNCIAHPHMIEGDNWLTAGMNTRYLRNKWVPRYEFYKIKTKDESNRSVKLGEVHELVASIPSSHRFGLSYFHSFGITENLIVFLEQPLIFSFKKVLMAALQNKPISSVIGADDKSPTYIHLINRHTGEKVNRQLFTDPLCLFHFINTYEERGEVIIDISAYDSKHLDLSKFTYGDMYSENLLGSPTIKTTPIRITVPKSSGSETKPQHCDVRYLNKNLSFELPVINYPRFNGKPYKFTYALNHFRQPLSIIKLLVQTPEVFLEKKYSESGEIELPSEPIFVERPNARDEDDGVILVTVLSDKGDYLSILDSKDLGEIARAELPFDVKSSFTFHGFFSHSIY